MTTTAPQFIELTLVAGTQLRTKIEVPDELQILEGTQEPEVGRFAFRIMDQLHGDKRVTWDSTSLSEIQAAKKMFIDLVKQGLRPFKVGVNGQKTSEIMTEFDARAEEILFIPSAKLVVGG